jgi:predicted hydrolase (HD superfamily)
LNTAEAEALVVTALGQSDRAVHSHQVGEIMKEFAKRTGRDEVLWHCVGLLHDLDYHETVSDRTQHGILASEQLRALLPAEALKAIASHDYRTSVHSDSELSRALRSADASACLLDTVGAEEIGDMIQRGADFAQLRKILLKRKYLADLLESYSVESGITLVDMLRISITTGAGNASGSPF